MFILRRIYKTLLYIYNSFRKINKKKFKNKQYVKDFKEKLNEIHIETKKSSSNADQERRENIKNLIHFFKKNDPTFFLTNNLIRYTMFASNDPFVFYEFAYLKKNNRKFRKRFLKENKIGLPDPFILYPKSSGNLIHHAYTLCRFFEFIGYENINDIKNIFEFGGGYGSVCRLMYKIGFGGKYTIYDFQFFSLLQSFYLNSIGLKSSYLNNTEDKPISCICDVENYGNSRDNGGKKMFLALWSLSETSLDFRKNFFNKLDIKDFDYYCIGFQAQFGEVDNNKYFKEFLKENNISDSIIFEIPHIKNSFYLFGKK